MTRLSSDLSQVQEREAMPKSIYISHIDACEQMKGKNAPYNPYINLSHMIEGDENGGPSEFAGRVIKYDNVMTGGVSKEGKPLALFELAKILEVYQIPATCLTCHTDATGNGYDGAYDSPLHFHRGTGDDGIRKGQWVCVTCKQPVNVSYDTANFIGKRARIAVDIENDQKGRPQNVVKDYSPAP